jgi:hypothetical protein
MKQGEIWEIRLDPAVGAEIQKTRPAPTQLPVVSCQFPVRKQSDPFQKQIASPPNRKLATNNWKLTTRLLDFLDDSPGYHGQPGS